MFLDFGSSSSSLIGTSYGIHQYIFIADFSGNVISWLKYPDGENAWDYPRWSSNGRFAVAAARDAADESRSIYVIDLMTGHLYKNRVRRFHGESLFVDGRRSRNIKCA